jgi:hypothetical protein
VNLLLTHGAEVNHVDDTGDRPLDMMGEDDGVFDILSKHGATDQASSKVPLTFI